jgi:hypothetical protein
VLCAPGYLNESMVRICLCVSANRPTRVLGYLCPCGRGRVAIWNQVRCKTTRRSFLLIRHDPRRALHELEFQYRMLS